MENKKGFLLMSIPKLLYKLWVTVTGINILSLKSIGQFDMPKLN